MSHRDGLALRSLVYHEILSAYLNYVKARGYTSMFIWACPPMAVSFSECLNCCASLCMPLNDSDGPLSTQQSEPNRANVQRQHLSHMRRSLMDVETSPVCCSASQAL